MDTFVRSEQEAAQILEREKREAEAKAKDVQVNNSNLA